MCMKVTQQHVSTAGNLPVVPDTGSAENTLVLVFGSTACFENNGLPARLTECYPGATIAGCTTSGEILNSGVEEESIVVSSLAFRHTTVRTHRVQVDSMDDSRQAGSRLAQALLAPDLAYLLVLSDGLGVNGSALVHGIRETLPAHVPFSGGLAGDGARFQTTFTLDNDGIHQNSVVGIGLYGKALSVERASYGGWAPFGPLRKVTRSVANVVYEIDGETALDVYSNYLGDEARDLPASGLLFPLAIAPETGKTGLIRTLLGIDRETGSLTFAGDVPEGGTVQLMHASYEELIEGARHAAEACQKNGGANAQFALLVSCVGRKLLLGANADMEVDAVVQTLGGHVPVTGFYSYGEIGTFEPSGQCELHNQTMTITSFSETD